MRFGNEQLLPIVLPTIVCSWPFFLTSPPVSLQDETFDSMPCFIMLATETSIKHQWIPNYEHPHVFVVAPSPVLLYDLRLAWRMNITINEFQV